MQSSAAPSAMPRVDDDDHDRLHGWALLAARLALGAAFLLTLILFALSVPFEHARDASLCRSAPCEGLQLDAPSAATLHGLGLALDVYAGYVVTTEVLLVVVYAGVAALIAWRRPADRAALLAAATLLTCAVGAFNPSLSALRGAQPVWTLPIVLLTAVGGVGFICFCYAFPDGRFVPRWTRWAALGWSLLYLPHAVLPTSRWDVGALPPVAQFAFWACFLATVAAAQVYRYRRVSSPLQRQQAKWVLLDLVVGGLGLVGLTVIALAVRVSVPRSAASALVIAALFGLPVLYLAFLCIPISIVVAMLRHRLFDVDVLLNRTLVYGTLTAALALVYVVCVVAFQALLGPAGLLGGLALARDSQVAIVASTLVSAALVRPVRRRLQAFIDRRFYRRKYSAEKTLAAFGATLRQEVDLSELCEGLVAVVQETMHPAHVSLWLRHDVEEHLSP
jgi:hypothetical protein